MIQFFHLKVLSILIKDEAQIPKYVFTGGGGWRQRGRVVRVPNLKSGGYGFKSRSDHLAGVVSRWTLVQLLGHACK